MTTVAEVRTVLARSMFAPGPRLGAYRDLAAFMGQGLSLGQALRALDDGSGSPRSRAAMEWMERINQGMPLSAAVRGWVPMGERNILLAAEESNDILSGIRNAEHLAEGERKIRSTMMAEIPYALLAALSILLATLTWLWGH